MSANIKEIEKDLKDNYSAYDDNNKFECMKLDVASLIRYVNELKEEITKLQTEETF